MNLIEYVTENLGEYKQHGEEINLKECPFCGKSKWKFYLNRKNGLYTSGTKHLVSIAGLQRKVWYRCLSVK